MFQIDARNGLWTIKHLACEASFQMTGDKILEATQTINCQNCAIPVNISYLKDAVVKLMHFVENISRASQRHNDPSKQAWQIDPPIKIVEKEENKLFGSLDLR